MSITEKTQQTRNMRFFKGMIKIYFLVIPPIENLEKSKKGNE